MKNSKNCKKVVEKVSSNSVYDEILLESPKSIYSKYSSQTLPSNIAGVVKSFRVGPSQLGLFNAATR
jgi:hypothetical protein